MFFETSSNLPDELVAQYWFSPRVTDTMHSIIPDGCVDLVYVHTQGNLGWYAFGTTTLVTQQPLINQATYFGIRLRPGKARLLVDNPLAQLTDHSQPIDLPLVPQPDGDFSAICDQASDFLSSLRISTSYATDTVQAAIQKIQKAQGTLSVKQIARDLAISERQLNRLFIQDVGVSPKVFSRINRFQHVYQRLQHQDISSLSSLALDAGYTDQAHFCRDFKAITGKTPKTYLAKQ